MNVIKHSRPIHWAVSALAAAAVAAGVTLWVTSVEGSGKSSATGQPPAQASWHDSFTDIPSMARAADVIVVGHTVADNEYVQDGITFTRFSFSVTESVKGSVKAGQQIPVIQTGGASEIGQRDVIEDDPLMEGNTTYLMFLRYDPVDQTYAVPGGPDGRFVVDSGKIKPLSKVYPDKNISDTGVSGLTISQVSQEIGVAPSPTAAAP